MKAVDRAVGGYVSYEFPGDPDRVGGAGCTLSELGDRLRRQSRSASRAGAQSCQQWRGSASVAYANRNNQHVRSAAADGKTLDGAGRTAQGFANDLRRIQRQSSAAVIELNRLTRELRDLLNQHSSGGPGRELGVAEDIQLLRRKIRAQESILEGLSADLVRLRKKFGDDLLGLVPLDMVVAYVVAGAKTTGEATTLVMKPANAATIIAAARRHRKAINAGDSDGAKKALQEIRRARSKLLAPPGNPVGMMEKAGKIAGSKPGRTILRPKGAEGVRKVVTPSRIAKVGSKATPVGAVLTMADGGRDAVTGGGKDGAQGLANRISGAGAVAGTPMLLLGGPATAAVGGVLVVGYLGWKAGMSLWDRHQGQNLKPPKTASERLRRMSPTMQRGTGAMSPGSYGQRRLAEEGGTP